MRHILTAMIMTQCQAMGGVLSKCSKVGVNTLADGLQGFKSSAMQGRMDTHTLGRTMIHGDKDGHLAVLPRESGGHIGPPHRVHTRGDDRPIMGFGSMGMAVTRWSQQPVSPHQSQHSAGRGTDTLIPQPGPHLAIAFPGERRRLQQTSDISNQLVIRTAANWPPPSSRLSRAMPVPVGGRACHAPHPADASQTIACNRSGSQNVTLALPSSYSVPCCDGNTDCLI